jgi:hypothetical protein
VPFLACAATSQRSTKSGFLKISTPSIPGWQSYVVSHITQAPELRFHKNISVYAKRGSSAETIGYVATNIAIHPFRQHRTNNRATTSAISTQRVQCTTWLLDCGGESDGGLVAFSSKRRLT